ncbi:hypothetical protein NA56DRAFT_664104 [Hyaloscypha hepaticicola]|uniref:Uncharacterized protein n=1 Tax=Hyaloscypha hepaticicola TaxID=2082293 RepID=A0A2J6PMF7_9HELO|nr:hypothetical protein NA56DRAFT_664104 [Hyaloscypha hepaticicola]
MCTCTMFRAIMSLFSFLVLFTSTFAAPLPAENLLNQTSVGLSARQLSEVYYGDACQYSSYLELMYPDQCYFTVSSEQVEGVYVSSLYLFRMDCTLIGYVSQANLEYQWYTMYSELPYTVDVITYYNVPQFNYAGQHHDAADQSVDSGFSTSWTENDNGMTDFMTRFIFDCSVGSSKPRSTTPEPSSLSVVKKPRQFSSIFTGDLCDPSDVFRTMYPNNCYLATNSEAVTFESFSFDGQPVPTSWVTSLYIFRMDCELIGYNPGVQLENQWFSFASQLPWTVDVITHNNVPQFNYGGQHYDAAIPGSGMWVAWDENDGVQTHITRFMFSC